MLHFHVIHVHVIHRLLALLRTRNDAEIALQLIIAGKARQRPWRILVPTRVIVARQVFSDFHDGEHPTHIDIVVFTWRADHRNTVARHRHAHFAHVSHAALAHRHITRE